METKMIEFARPDGKKAPGYLEMPVAGKNAPAVVVIQEWWGLNNQIKGVADRLAKAGYRALVPDLFRGKLAKDRDEASHMMDTLDWGGAILDMRGAVQHLKSFAPSKVAVLGFCMGGALTLIASVKIPEVDAGIDFYGIPPAQAADPSQIRVPMQFHFATKDDWCNPQAIAKLEDAMKRGKVSYELHRYEGTEHAFMNEARPEVHDARAASLAWEHALKFLATHLSS
jgi:carboxymethylenebutenolidase